MKSLAILLLLGIGWQSAAGEEAVVRVAERPQGQVADSSGWLPAEEAEALDQRLRRLRSEDQIDMMVVVLPSPPQVRPGVFAGQMLSYWGEGDAQTLILHVVGDPDAPWMVVDGRTVRLAGDLVTREAMLDARKVVAAAGNDRERLRAAIDEMEDLLHFLSYRGRYQEERLRAVQASHQLDEMERQLNTRVLITGSAAAAGVLLVALGMGAYYWTRYRAPLWFPATSWRLRFGAPYCGGNDAVLRFDRRDPRN